MVLKEYNYYYPLDVARFLLAFFVIAIHTTKWDCEYINRSLELAVPFFFFTSGFFLQQKSHNATKGDVIKKWLSRVIKMYMIWTLVYIPFTIYGFFFEKDTLPNCFMGILLGTGKYAWHLWYLVASIIGGGIILLYKKLKINFIFVLLISFGIYMLFSFLDQDFPEHYILFAVKRIVRGLIFLLLGMGIWTVWPILKRYILPLVLSSFVLLVLYIKLGGDFYFLGCAALFFIILLLCDNIKCETAYGFLFRKLSAYIYFIHMLFVGILTMAFEMDDSLMKLLVVSILSLVFAYFRVRFSLMNNKCAS